jgi:hypothetical protein
MTSQQAPGDRVALIASLGIPGDAKAPRRYIDEDISVSAAGLAALVDDEVAERLWRRWNPAQAARIDSPPFRTALREFLASGAAMGYALDRFRAACQSLPEPDRDGERWVEPFERAVVATNTMDLRVFVSPHVRDSFAATNESPASVEPWDALCSKMADGLFYELGIIPPKVQLLGDSSLASTELRIEINDARLPRSPLLAYGRALVNDTVDRLTLLNVRGEAAVNPANGSECATIAATDVEFCRQAGLMTWTPMEHGILTISGTVRRMAGAFANCYLVDVFLDRLAQAFPTVVAEARKAMSRDGLAQVLRALLDEEICIRNLLRILEVLTLPETVCPADLARHIVLPPSVLARMQWYVSEPALERRVNRVRASMNRYISHKYTRGANTLVVYLLETDLEARLALPVALSPQDHASLLQAVGNEVGTLPPTTQNPVILTTASIRRRLRREIAAAMPYLAVLSYQELSPDMNIQPIARITAPELTDPLAQLAQPQADGVAVESSPPACGDRLAQNLYSLKPEVMAALRKAGFEAHTERLMGECLDAILGELASPGAAARLAAALQDRAHLPTAWNRVVELILPLGAAAQAALDVPAAELPEERRQYFADRARIRDATHETARRVAAAGLLTAHGNERQ